MATVTFFHAHPDDEAIATGGTMASLAEQGHRVVLVTATRGELGEVDDGFLDPGEALGARRAVELAEAARVLGVARQLFLGYEDSGMEGEASAERPGCFATADMDEAAGRLAAILDEEASDVLVVYDEHGGYGHPDHVQVHRVGMAAADRAGTPVVYMATMDRDFMLELRRQAAESEFGPGDDLEGAETMGEPSARITTELDVSPWVGTKRDAMRAHASQIDETSFFLAMPDDLFADGLGPGVVHPGPAGTRGPGRRRPRGRSGGRRYGRHPRRRGDRGRERNDDQAQGAACPRWSPGGGRAAGRARSRAGRPGRPGVHPGQLVRRRRQRLPGAGRLGVSGGGHGAADRPGSTTRCRRRWTRPGPGRTPWPGRGRGPHVR